MGASQWKNTSDSIPTALEEVHVWVIYKGQFSRKSNFPLTRCILLLSFISAALTPLEKQKLICNRPEKCKETSARDSKPEFDPSFYIEGQTEEPILTGLFLRRKLALVAGPWDELSVSIPAMVGMWRKDFVILILQFVHFPKYMFSF